MVHASPVTALSPLPDEAVRGRLSLADADRLGVTRTELRSALWRSPHRGIHVFGPAPELSTQGTGQSLPVDRILDAAALLPGDGAVGGWAAAHLLDTPFHDGVGADGRTALTIPLLVPAPRRPRPRTGITWVRGNLDTSDVVSVGGLRVTSPVRTAFGVARDITGKALGSKARLEAGVVSLDAVLHAGLVSRPQLAQELRRRTRWPGIGIARRAWDLADARAESPQESRLRLVWVLGGLPMPHVNVPVFDRDGRHLATPDLFDEESALALEYDGAHHRALRRQARDNVRAEGLEAHGVTVLRVTGLDLPDASGRLFLRLVAARARGLERDRSKDKWLIHPDLSGPPSRW